jgi:drug/metabolite transporter, DME family
VTSRSRSGDRSPHLGRGLLLVFLAGVIWGSIGTAVQIAHQRSGLSPSTISAYRAAIAVVTLVAVSAAGGRLRSGLALARTQWRRVGAVGLLTAAFQLLFFVAVVAAGVGVSTVVCLGAAPVLVLVMEAVRRRRPPSLAQAVTTAAALLGLLLVSTASGGSGEARNPTLGLLAALGSGAAYALSAEVGSPLSRRLDTLALTTATMAVAAAALVPTGILLAVLRDEPTTTGDLRSWLLVGYLGVVTMAFAYALLFAALRSTPSGVAVVATLIEPVTALVLAAVVLGEGLSAAGVVGSLLIVAAIGSLGRLVTDPQPQ